MFLTPGKSLCKGAWRRSYLLRTKKKKKKKKKKKLPQPKNPSMGDWLNKQWFAYETDCSSAVKNE